MTRLLKALAITGVAAIPAAALAPAGLQLMQPAFAADHSHDKGDRADKGDRGTDQADTGDKNDAKDRGDK